MWLNTASLLWGTVASVMVVAVAVTGLIRSLKKRWIQENDQVKALGDNTKAAERNSEALRRLGEKLDTYATRTDAKLTDHDLRLTRLEAFKNGRGS